MARMPFSREDLLRLQRSFLFSPKQYVNCGRGHPVDLALSTWQVKKDRNGWHAELKCSYSETFQNPRTTGFLTATCRSHAVFALPADLADARVPAHPGHSSSDWRDKAELLPRLDGIYTCTVKVHRSFSGPKKLEDWCVVFGEAGEVVNFEMKHEGYKTNYPWYVSTHLITRHFHGGVDLFEKYGLDLFRVDGTNISWTWIHPDGTRTRALGVLHRGARKITLTGTSGPDNKTAKYDFEFRPLRTPPFA